MVFFIFLVTGWMIILLSPVPVEGKDLKVFREDFSSDKLSIFRWGMPTFTLYNFRADPEMVMNVSGINYLRLGPSERLSLFIKKR